MGKNKDRRLKSQPGRSSGFIPGLLQQEARVGFIAAPRKKNPNYIMDNNKLSGLAFNLPENKFEIVEEAKRPVPLPRKWYRDENGVKHPIPAPRKKKGGKIPIRTPRTKIGEKRKALNGYTKSYEMGINSNFVHWNSYKI